MFMQNNYCSIFKNIKLHTCKYYAKQKYSLFIHFFKYFKTLIIVLFRFCFKYSRGAGVLSGETGCSEGVGNERPTIQTTIANNHCPSAFIRDQIIEK